MNSGHEPQVLDLLLTDYQRREKFPHSDRAKALRLLTAHLGEGGMREFLRQPQPALGDRTGAELLERDPVELLRRLEAMEATPDLDDIEDVPTVFEEVSGVRHMRKAKDVNKVLSILNELERGNG